jgi:hypothetical protein
MDCGSFWINSDYYFSAKDRTGKYALKFKCRSCEGINIIDYPEYLPVEQAGRYFRLLKKKT